MLTRLSEWAGTAGNLRAVGGDHAAADLKREPEDWRPSAEHWVRGESEQGDDERPGERMPVFAIWGDPAVRHCEVVVTVRALATEAAALSFMSRGAHDVRPHILLAMFAQHPGSIATCIAHATRYLRVWVERAGDRMGADVIEAAAADAFAVLYVPRQPRQRHGGLHEGTPPRLLIPADERAKQFGMRANGYRTLRRIALRMFRRRLLEACVSYHVGRRSTPAPLDSKIGSPSPPASAIPRELPPDIWQQLSNWAA